MADAELRELERAFQASGAVDDEARLLQAQLRTGVLARERVALAGALGHAASQAVAHVGPAPRRSLKGWLDHLIRLDWPKDAGWHRVPLGWQVAVRACVAIARALPPDDASSPRPLEAAEDWCRCPCLRCSVACHRAGKGTDVRTGAARLASTPGGLDVFPGPSWIHRVAAELCGDGARQLGGIPRMRDAATAELVPWALGRADPVRARVEARGG